jgi:iron complex outermembrane receptor protein
MTMFAAGMATASERLRGTARIAAAWTMLAFSASALLAQAGGLRGTVTDPKGGLIAGALVTVTNNATGKKSTATADAQGHYAISGLAPGSYTVQASSTGFSVSTRKGIQVGGGDADVPAMTLQVTDATDEVSVDANETHSIAAALAPMDALLDERSARTEITSAFIQNFASPLADYGEAVEMAPGTFTTNGNGIGLGQSKTYFRGFPDGDYDIDFDGLPFYDTNTPTHHSWAFFPSQWLGGIDFDRSPGTASTIGPTPFGGSIHLLSRELSPVQNIRSSISYGSYGTLLADVQYDSGAIGRARKFFVFMDVQHMDSKGYETNNFQNRTGGSIKMQYKFSDKTVLTGFSGVIQLTANTPNFNATRCQLYGLSATSSYTCTTGTGAYAVTSPYTGAGINFYLAPASDIYSGLNYTYNRYKVPTDFEYVGFKTELPGKVAMEFKPYTYNYDNAEVYSNAVPITESTTLPGMVTVKGLNYYQGVQIIPCNGVTAAAGATAAPATAPCGVDKYNSYRKYGETLQFTKVTKPVIARAGLWYEWARTNRHQFPADPLQGYKDVGLPNFSEMFWNNSYQPYAELEFHPLKKLMVTAGTKFAYFTIDTRQLPDNGKTIGNLCQQPVAGVPCVQAPFVTNHGSYSAWLPSLDANYRIRNNWSAYGQISTGSIVPPSSVFDYNQTITPANPNPTIQTPAKQQRSTTYQFGTVAKLKRVTLDMDFYHVKFQNSYTQSTTLDPVVFYLQPGSITKGFEAESNIYLFRGLSAYLNASAGNAYYHGTMGVSCTSGTAGCTASTPQLVVPTPSGLWVATTPTDTEAEGLTYQNKGFDVGFFNKRVGSLRQDNGAYHNQGIVNPFTVSNMFLNYTVRAGSWFDQTRIRLSINNLLEEHNLTSLGLKGTPVTQNLSSGGLTYKDPFNETTPVSGLDQLGLLPGRTITLSVTFGITPKR